MENGESRTCLGMLQGSLYYKKLMIHLNKSVQIINSVKQFCELYETEKK